MGRVRKVSREMIMETALSLSEEEGVSSLSMRTLGGALGVEAMTLYKYVGKKEELLSHLLVAVLEEVELPQTDDWRRDLETGAERIRAALCRHAGSAELILSSDLGQQARLRVLEWVGAVLRLAIPQPLDRAYALSSLFSYVVGQSVARTQERTASFWGDLGETEFPELSSLGPVLSDAKQELEFELGLSALLNGIEARNPY